MAVWSYVPEGILAEALTADVRAAEVAPQAHVLGVLTNSALQALRVTYLTVETTTCASMLAFYEARRGPFEAFDFFHEAKTVRVRFDSELRAELFEPGYLRTGELRFVVVSS